MTLKFCKHIIHASLCRVIAVILLVSLLSGCAGNSFEAPEEPELPVEEVKVDYVNLDLRISVDDGAASGSRAFDYKEDGDFEAPNSNYEMVHTLRVVIVRENKTIEHNRMVTVRYNYGNTITSGDIINDNLQFKVVAGEKKWIYLFANERAVNRNKADDKIFDFTDSLAVGKVFPDDDVSNILIERVDNKAFIDNGSSTPLAEKSYVPMSEFFEVEIPAFEEINADIVVDPSGVAEKYIEEHLFLTRSLIKFSFSVKVKEGVDVGELNDIKLVGVSISNLANDGFYLPKDTKYSPDKRDKSNNELGGRKIEEFEVPKNPGASNCNFFFDNPLPLSLQENGTQPLIYLPESKIKADDKYELTLKFNNNDLNEIYGSRPLTIQNIPRNTHVKIAITIGPILDVTVTVLPYTGVWLNPTFGIDRVEPVTGVRIDPPELTMNVGATGNLTAEVTRDDETYEQDKYVTWTSVDEEIATVTEDKETGKATVKAIKSGSTTIIARYINGKSGYCTVTVTEASGE